MMNKGLFLKTLASITLLLHLPFGFGQITIRNPTTVDVTTSGFSAIWQTDVATESSIQVFSDATGSLEVTSDFETLHFPVRGGNSNQMHPYDQAQFKSTLRASLQGLGHNVIRVNGLSPDTTYYYKVFSEADTETVEWPAGANNFEAVTTAGENSFLSESSQILVTINNPNTEGWLVTAHSDEVEYGTSALVGDGAGTNQAFLNLSAMFGANGRNWMPIGTKTITIDVWTGFGARFNQNISIDFTGEFSISTLRSEVVDISTENLITVTVPGYPSYHVGNTVPLEWIDEADETNASISLYYDSDNRGEDGTLIAENIEEDADGPGDQYPWDTTSVPDGIYYVYAQMNEAGDVISSYAPAPIALDRIGGDSDGDGIADLWERLHFGSLDQEGDQDTDSDGQDDANEFTENTDPNTPDFRMQLEIGLNIVSIPIVVGMAANADELRDLIGNAVVSIKQVVADSGKVLNSPGENYPLQPGLGLMIDMTMPHDVVLRGQVGSSDELDLSAGVNIVGFREVPFDYSAYQLIQALGDNNVVSSIQRFDLVTGRYQMTAYTDTGAIVGDDFPIKRGEGYIVSLRQSVSGFAIQ